MEGEARVLNRFCSAGLTAHRFRRICRPSRILFDQSLFLRPGDSPELPLPITFGSLEFLEGFRESGNLDRLTVRRADHADNAPLLAEQFPMALGSHRVTVEAAQMPYRHRETRVQQEIFQPFGKQPLPSGFRAARFLRAENVRAAMSKYPDDLKTFTELWMNAYHPDSPLLFDSPAAATKFVKAARAIGFDETAFEQSRPTDLSATSPLAQVLPWQTLPPKTRLPFRQDKMPIRRRTRIAVGLDRKASPIPHSGTLNRIAFVLAVWVRLGSQETPTASGL